MKKIELLAPAGNMECLKAAVMAGCDAVYLGGDHFGARAFSKNFSREEIVTAIKYCHLYGVRVYVTVNTLVYDNEVDDFLNYIEFIHKNNVDAIIIQDLGMFDLVRKTFPKLEIHASTQMHIHNLDGVKLMEKLGMKRVVLARETSIDKIKEIKDNSNVELEVFVHGALCISYSGQCLMSSLIGGRSGNRGTCAGSCRLKYDIVNENGKKLNTLEYPLSTKDLNSLDNIGKLIDIGVSSLKIEGRMKSLEYVYMVVKIYREAIDSYYDTGRVYIDLDKLKKLKKIFNREYTKGFLGNTNNDDIINGYRPNHMGVDIGRVIDYNKGIARIKLKDNLVIGSGLRVIGKNDVGIKVNEFYINGKLVKEANEGDTISIKVLDKVYPGDKVVITLDKKINDDIERMVNANLRKVDISGKFIGRINEKMKLMISDGVNEVYLEGNVLEEAKKNPTKEEDIRIKLNKLGNTIYEFKDLDIEIDNNVFIPIGEVNELRRMVLDKLSEKRLYDTEFIKEKYYIDVPSFKRERLVSCLVNKKEDIDKLDMDYDIIYCYQESDKSILKLPRVIDKYPDNLNLALVGDIGAFYHGKNLYTDFSLNVVNSYTVAFLHSLGAKMVTLSYELTELQIKELIDNYLKRYGSYPSTEVIVSGYEEVMISKFSLNKFYKNDNIYLRDMFGNRYKIVNRDNLMYIYNYKKRECYSDRLYDMGVNSLRFNFDR